MKTWQNWGRTLRFKPKKILYPSSERALVDIMHECRKNNWTPKVVGSGHSWTHLCQTPDVLISLDRYQGLEAIDKVNNVVTVKAGTKINLLTEALHQKGLALENLGDVDVQSIAGATATGTHGTGIEFGNISTQIVGLRLLIPTGEIFECSETENPEIFKAAQISLGALGIITSLKLRCQPTYKLDFSERKETVNNCLANLDRYIQENRNFEFYWFPHTDAVQTKFSNTSNKEVKDNSMVNYVINDLILENGIFGALSAMTRIMPSLSKRVAQISGAAISSAYKTNWSHRVYATARLVRFREMEYNIPIENFLDVFEEIQDLFDKKKFKVHFPTENRFVKGDDIYLSPAYGRDSAYIAAHVYLGKEYKAYFDALESVYKNHQGRPHWGKMHNLKADQLSKLYPMWDTFQLIRSQLDPQGLLLNDYLRDLFGVKQGVQHSMPI